MMQKILCFPDYLRVSSSGRRKWTSDLDSTGQNTYIIMRKNIVLGDFKVKKSIRIKKKSMTILSNYYIFSVTAIARLSEIFRIIKGLTD